jgi:predicted Zn-dependent protease
MNKGDDLLSKGDADAAFTAYDAAANLAPHLLELPFWQAVTLIETGREEQAFPILKKVITTEPDWLVLLERLPSAGLLREDPVLMEKIRKLLN